MIVFVALLLAAEQPANSALMMERAGKRLSVAEPASPGLADRRYRIADDDSAAPTAKDRAFAENGQRCNLIGGRRCTSKPRTLLSAELVR